MIKLNAVSFSYGKKQILRDFSLEVNDGECVVLSGESGCGKSTVALLVLGLRTPNGGTVDAPDRISAVFQEDRFAESLTLISNLRTALDKEQLKDAEELIGRLGLNEYKSKKISEFSGGMKRRAALIRALAFGGDALIIDEAFNGVDSENKKICAELIKERFLKKNKPVLFITHIESDAEMLGARIINIKRAD